MKLSDRLISRGLLTIENNPKTTDVIEVYHELMLCYGFIPFKEFLELPIVLIDRLCELMKRDIKRPKFVVVNGFLKNGGK